MNQKALTRISRASARRFAQPLELSEADIARTCSGILMIDGWRMLITDPVSDNSRGKGFGEPGMADRLYIRYASIETVRMAREQPALPAFGSPLTPEAHRSIWADEVMWIEWKRTRRGVATKPTAHQLAWHRAERSRGAFTLIAGIDFPATIEGFRAWYAASGLARRV